MPDLTTDDGGMRMGEGRKVKLSERTADRLCELIMDERQFTPGEQAPE